MMIVVFYIYIYVYLLGTKQFKKSIARQAWQKCAIIYNFLRISLKRNAPNYTRTTTTALSLVEIIFYRYYFHTVIINFLIHSKEHKWAKRKEKFWAPFFHKIRRNISKAI
jgi:hydrogenase-4 membrane subunit HyfE